MVMVVKIDGTMDHPTIYSISSDLWDRTKGYLSTFSFLSLLTASVEICSVILGSKMRTIEFGKVWLAFRQLSTNCPSQDQIIKNLADSMPNEDGLMVLLHLSNGSEEDMETIVRSPILKVLISQLRNGGRSSPLLLHVIARVAEKSKEGRLYMIRKRVIPRLSSLVEGESTFGWSETNDISQDETSDDIRSRATYALRSFCVDSKELKELDDQELAKMRMESQQVRAQDSRIRICRMGYKTRIDELNSSFWKALYINDGKGVCGCIPCTALIRLHPYNASCMRYKLEPERKVPIFSRLLSSKCEDTIESACMLLYYVVDGDQTSAGIFCTDGIIPKLTRLARHETSTAIRYKASLAMYSIVKQLDCDVFSFGKLEYLVEKGVVISFCVLLSDKEIINTVEVALIGLMRVSNCGEV
mmetsp:Transcript_13040/g.21225  ORF Transcript_13040/g.21225 Transcript_13040/m.21225 type:complete len:415 (+) Transcript_13040:45-1289(+)